MRKSVLLSDSTMYLPLFELFIRRIGEHATSPTPKHTNEPLMNTEEFYDFLERAAVLDEKHVAAVVLAIFR